MIKATNKTILVSIFIGQKIYKTNLQIRESTNKW